jgi:hypothetical protein
MVRFLTAAALILLVAAPAAHADRAAADRCAASLPPGSRAIYAQSIPAVLSGQTIADAITPVARSMVMGGSMARADARPAAEAAGECLKLLR